MINLFIYLTGLAFWFLFAYACVAQLFRFCFELPKKRAALRSAAKPKRRSRRGAK